LGADFRRKREQQKGDGGVALPQQKGTKAKGAKAKQKLNGGGQGRPSAPGEAKVLPQTTKTGETGKVKNKKKKENTTRDKVREQKGEGKGIKFWERGGIAANLKNGRPGKQEGVRRRKNRRGGRKKIRRTFQKKVF